MSSYGSKQKAAGGESFPSKAPSQAVRPGRHSYLPWVVVALGTLGVFWWHQSHRQDGPPPPPSGVTPKTPPLAQLPASDRAPRSEPATVLPSAAADPYGMPPPSLDQVHEPPPPPQVTAEEHHQSRQAARTLVENGIIRLENEGRKAAQSGDAETAHRNELRVARLRKRLAALSAVPPP